MKIRQIRFKNINSFYGEHPPIVFSEGLLAQTGLFVIAGPTGAGKSTLLDVITLALFNRVPRITDGDGRGLSKDKITLEGLIVNQKAVGEPKTEAYAEVDYELQDGAYRSRWSIARNRNGNWNDYEMEVARLPDNQLISAKKSDVPGLNVKYIGLTYEQFIRSMVLAQGAFDKFLKASSGDRSKMLEQITGTDIYRRLSQGAHQEYKQRNEELDSKRQQAGAIQLLSDDHLTQLTQQQQDIETRLTELTTELTQFRAEHKLVEDIQQAELTLAELAKQADELTRHLALFSEKDEQLIRHQQVADLGDQFSGLSNTEHLRLSATRDRRQAADELQTQQQQLHQLLLRVQTLLRQPALMEDQIETQLNQFREQVESLSNQINEATFLADQHRKNMQPLLTDQLTTMHDLSDPEHLAQLVTATSARQQVVTERLSTLSADYPIITPATIQPEINRLEQQAQAIGELIRLQEEQQQRLIDAQTLLQKRAEQRELINQQTPALDRIQQAVSQLEARQQELDDQKVRLARESSVDDLRQALQENEPCPLCGSLHHPYAHQYVQQAGTLELQLRLLMDELSQKKAGRDKLHREVIQAQTTEKSYAEQLDTTRHHYREKGQIVTAKLTALGFDETYTPEVLKDSEQLTRQQLHDLAEWQRGQAQTDVLSRLVSESTDLLTITTQLNKLKRDRQHLYAGDDIKQVCNQLLGNVNHIRQSMASQRGLLMKADADFHRLDQQYTRQHDELRLLLAQRNLADIDSARACLLDAPTLRQFQQEQQALSKRSHELTVKTAQTTQARQVAINARQTALPADEVNQHLLKLVDEERQKRERVGHLKAQLTADAQQRKQHLKLARKLGEMEQQLTPWRALNELIGSANGNEFSRFAQRLTLAQLIGLANQRLRHLSDRYLLLKPRDGQNELYVLDQYQGGAERTVTSLSGGETFTLSLALALALSDLASHNVQIDSLFVDEGFGTLDPETLDTAIEMLEKLQQQTHKTIGIISHRHEIKERISVQIQVDKGHDGSSRVRLVEL